MHEPSAANISVKRITVLLIVVLAGILVLYRFGRPLWTPVYIKLSGGQTVRDVLREIGEETDVFWRPLFDRASVPYPPESIQLLAFKEEAIFEVWAGEDNVHRFITEFPITSRSGTIGPKRREFDRQVPEGVYRISGLNPNSAFHLSMKVDYPNEWDVEHADAEDVDRLGGDIFVHGGSASIGCIALGNENIEKVFALVARTGVKGTGIVIAPFDLRGDIQSRELPNDEGWYAELYDVIANHLASFPVQ